MESMPSIDYSCVHKKWESTVKAAQRYSLSFLPGPKDIFKFTASPRHFHEIDDYFMDANLVPERALTISLKLS